MLIEVIDGSTRKTHRAVSGSIQKITSKFWRFPNSWFPPNGFNCRGRTRSLTDKQAKARGAPIMKAIAPPDFGFGGNSAINIFRPERRKYDKDIWDQGRDMEPRL